MPGSQKRARGYQETIARRILAGLQGRHEEFWKVARRMPRTVEARERRAAKIVYTQPAKNTLFNSACVSRSRRHGAKHANRNQWATTDRAPCVHRFRGRRSSRGK